MKKVDKARCSHRGCILLHVHRINSHLISCTICSVEYDTVLLADQKKHITNLLDKSPGRASPFKTVEKRISEPKVALPGLYHDVKGQLEFVDLTKALL